jgi:7-carboxy-7-deazaguanine synthase
MTFVRLAGCNAPALGLECVSWCDTPGSWGPSTGRPMELEEILEQAHFPRLCLTGGEPLLQLEEVAGLIEAAERRFLRVHLETNGTIDPRPALCGDRGLAWATVSPKPPDYFIATGWEGLVDELKLVVDDRLDAATAERLAAAHPGAIVTIQPVWGGAAVPAAGGAVQGAGGTSSATAANSERCERAVALVMAHPDWRLSLQTHKYLGIR